MQLLRAVGQRSGRRRFGELAALVCRVGGHLAAQHVQDLVKARAGIDRQSERENAVAEVLADLGQRLVEIRLFLVKRIDDQDFRNAVPGRAFPHRVRANTDAVVGMHHNQGQVADPQRTQRLADEIGVARAIQDVQLLALPLRVHERGGHRNLPILFAFAVVRHGGAGGDAAHAVDHARAGQHGLAEQGLSARGMTDDCEVANVTRLIVFHKNLLPILSLPN